MSTGCKPFFSVMLTRLRAVPGRCAGIALAQVHPKMICLERVLNSERNRSDGLTVQTLKLQLFDFFFFRLTSFIKEKESENNFKELMAQSLAFL